ncbi:hypothetical protein KEM56_002962, partial [Ascosphaera pollenicola]
MVAHSQKMTITPVNVKGISGAVEVQERVTFDLLVPARLENQSVTCKVRIEAHIVPKMRIGLLIGTDNMKPERMVVDLDEGRIR